MKSMAWTENRSLVLPTIAIVDDSATNLTVGRNILRSRYRVYSLPSATALFGLLENTDVDLILLDIEMPGMDGYEALRKLKGSAHWRDIPVIFLTGASGLDSQLCGMSLGASDYVTKPFTASRLLDAVQTHLPREAYGAFPQAVAEYGRM